MSILSSIFGSPRPDYSLIVRNVAASGGRGIVESKYEGFAKHLRGRAKVVQSTPDTLQVEGRIGGVEKIILLVRERSGGRDTGRVVISISAKLPNDPGSATNHRQASSQTSIESYPSRKEGTTNQPVGLTFDEIGRLEQTAWVIEDSPEVVDLGRNIRVTTKQGTITWSTSFLVEKLKDAPSKLAFSVYSDVQTGGDNTQVMYSSVITVEGVEVVRIPILYIGPTASGSLYMCDLESVMKIIEFALSRQYGMFTLLDEDENFVGSFPWPVVDYFGGLFHKMTELGFNT